MLKDKLTLATVQSDDTFLHIRQRLFTETTEVIDRFGLACDKRGKPNPKMAMSLASLVYLAIEEHYAGETRQYVEMRLEEQIARYVALGFHAASGYSEGSFRAVLAPLVAEVVEFFKPPSVRPVRDGEFTLLLVLPPRMVPTRLLLTALLSESLADDVNRVAMELRSGGAVAPDEPYVLIGIDGGRGQKSSSIGSADEYVKHSARTYFSLRQLVHLLLIRPHFLSRESDFSQSEVLVLGEKRNTELVSFVASAESISVECQSDRNMNGGVGAGKPHYARMITA